MKRGLCILLCTILLCTTLAGCDNRLDSTQETIHPYIAELIDSLPASDAVNLPDQLIAETDQYTFSRMDGICYLSFKSGNYEIDINEKDGYRTQIQFNSLDELYQWLNAPQITAETETIIRHLFPLDNNHGFILPDPERLYTIEIPGYTQGSVSLRNNCYQIGFTSQEHLNNDSKCGFFVSFCRKDIFSKWLMNHYRFKLRSKKLADPDFDTYQIDHITYYEMNINPDWRRRFAQYELQIDNRILFIEEHFTIMDANNPSISAESPVLYDVDVLGYENGAYFSLANYCDKECTYGTTEIDLGKELKIVEYVPQSS